jgi:hypothetical protein
MEIGCLRASTAADAGPWITESLGLTAMITSDVPLESFEVVVPQPEMVKIEHSTAKRFKYEGVMVYGLIFI